MNCTVTFRHMKTSDAVRSYAEEKIDKISKLLDSQVEAQVTLTLENHVHVAHIELVTDGSLQIRGTHKSSDMYASLDAAVDHIARQVKRYRSKIRSHRGQAQGHVLPYKVYAVETAEEPKPPQIVSQETVVARRMSVEDAVMQLDLADSDFLVFTNGESQLVNVVYRLPDGQYGLIEAHASSQAAKT
ncbi:MAG: ribosome hibernation-promoting factor, HPF/YfiA family [Myxococcota bacterium]